MLGFSVYLSIVNESYIQKMISYGFTTIFTSLQIPEEDIEDKFTKLKELKSIAGQNVKIIVDINPIVFQQIEDEDRCGSHSGLDAIRFDESIDIEKLLHWSNHADIVLNASTDGLNILRSLKSHAFDYSKVYIAHNYYPRPETGLDTHFFRKVNKEIKSEFPGINIIAFISGNELRGPVFKGLPTLEDHRFMHPIVAYQELKSLDVDVMMIGDTAINDFTIYQFSQYITSGTITLRADIIDDYKHIYDVAFNNRLDVARDVIRAEQYRKLNQDVVEPNHIGERLKGSITLDNRLYGRYMNELQITKVDLAENEAVNVIGNISEEDIPLIDLIKSGTKFKFVRGVEDGY
ncbi:MupG family TIM beta-alpha barrel fold protein [Macrococcus animalis]|uniref:MupG family TIM beta-alpha barrel fold protein n=1 Tax=Macrococcus animalis TaxID=3395467 RepID=UPI0039BE4E34